MKNNMKWRITGRFLITVICVVVTVIIINIVSLLGLRVYREINNVGVKNTKPRILLEIFLRILKK